MLSRNTSVIHYELISLLKNADAQKPDTQKYLSPTYL